MRQFNRFCAVTLLSLAIGTSALAGDVQAPAGPTPPPPPPVVLPTPPPVDPSNDEDTGVSGVITSITIELLGLISIF